MPRVTHMYMCTCVSALGCACVCMNNEIAPFSGFLLSFYKDIFYIRAHSSDFSSCGTIFMFLCAQVAWCRLERPIAQFNHDRRLSLK